MFLSSLHLVSKNSESSSKINRILPPVINGTVRPKEFSVYAFLNFKSPLNRRMKEKYLSNIDPQKFS